MQYTRRPNDVQFRRVLLTKSDEPEFENFTSDSQMINYSDNTVLEIRQSDGRTRLEYGSTEKKTANYHKHGGQICLSSSVPTATMLEAWNTKCQPGCLPGQMETSGSCSLKAEMMWCS